MTHPVPRRVSAPATYDLAFSICTLVNKPKLYDRMLRTFTAGGFTGSDVEYLYVDNSRGNAYDAYAGLNCLLSQARGEYVILCHQDVALIEDGRAELVARLAELDARDPLWAVAGNAGGLEPADSFGNRAKGRVAIRITDITSTEHDLPGLPLRAISLDENFILVRNEARLAFSADLSGFHLYGTDICLQAEARGRTSYVIDFHLLHDGLGGMNGFKECQAALEKKFLHYFRRRRIMTTCTVVRLTHSLQPAANPPPLPPPNPPRRPKPPKRRPWWARLGSRYRR